jgi:membrane protease YdiL (CAAX protease family)
MAETLPTPPERDVFRLALVFEGGLAVLAIVLGWWMTPPVWERVRWEWSDFGLGILATLPLAAGLLFLRRVQTGPLGRLNEVVDRLLVPLFGSCSLIQLALISALAGIGEELLFRGVLQPVLIGWLGTWAGLAIASVAFGLVHAVTPTYAVLATLVGVYFGGLAIATENLLTPLITHGLYDFVALVYLTRGVKPLSPTQQIFD